MRKHSIYTDNTKVYVFEGVEDSPLWSAAVFAVAIVLLIFIGMCI